MTVTQIHQGLCKFNYVEFSACLLLSVKHVQGYHIFWDTGHVCCHYLESYRGNIGQPLLAATRYDDDDDDDEADDDDEDDDDDERK